MSVTVYCVDGCPYCEGLLDDLRRRRVTFVEVNLTREPHRIAELAGLTWERRLPILVDHERCSVGFRGGSSSFEQLGLEEPGRRP